MNKKTIAPLLLCFGSVACTVGAVIASAKAAPKASAAIKDAKAETTKDKIKATWKIWAPTAGLVVLSAACSFGSHGLHRKYQAAILSSAALARQKFAQYQNKVREICGEELHQKAADRVKVEKCKPVPIESCGGWYVLEDEFQDLSDEPIRLIYDSWSDRYLETTIPKLLEAEIHFSRNFTGGAAQSLNDFYDFLGASHTEKGDSVGWAIEDDWFSIDFIHERVKTDDGRDMYVLGSIFPPSDEFLQYR